MSITRLTEGPGLPAGFPFSLSATSDQTLFISGMPALDPQGAFQAGPFLEELDRAWQRILDIVRASGREKEDLVYVQCVLGDMGDYDALNGWWRDQFNDLDQAPARFTYAAGGLPFGAKIEVQAVAGTRG